MSHFYNCLALSPLALLSESLPMQIRNFSPLTAIAVGPAGPPSMLYVSPYSSPSTAIVVGAGGLVKDTDFQWVLLGLTVETGTKVTGVEVCYQVLGRRSTYISQVRLTEMSAPNVAVVRHDDPTNLRSTAPICYRSKASGFVVKGTITLALKIVIGKPGDRILIGKIALES